MIVKMDIIDIEEMLKWKLEWQEGHMSQGEGNACVDMDEGTIQALKDVLNAIDIYDAQFKKYLPAIMKARLKDKTPHYDPACDKCNGDSWFISSYKDIINMFI